MVVVMGVVVEACGGSGGSSGSSGVVVVKE